MPLPFSFSTQRQSSEAARPAEPAAMVISEKVMHNAPGHVSTEPLLGTLGSTFSSPVLESASRAVPHYPALAAAHVPPARISNVPFADNLGAALPLPGDLTVQQVPRAPSVPSVPVAPAAGSDWAAQIEQLRNDIFGIAMNVSALNDRLDRMEQRLPQTGQSLQAGIATLRGEIETWLENHLNAAVEHCMHRITSRPNSSVSPTAS